ncbi:LIM domain-containing protein C4F6.12 [Fusarium oxysporum f. sp. albedinis]|nr:LIM domain-containing protein C4F6.12 [Fusarium oxysporum f. sp. albedinis]
MMEVLVLGDESAKCDVCVAPESEEGGATVSVCHLYLVARRTSVETGYREGNKIFRREMKQTGKTVVQYDNKVGQGSSARPHSAVADDPKGGWLLGVSELVVVDKDPIRTSPSTNVRVSRLSWW